MDPDLIKAKVPVGVGDRVDADRIVHTESNAEFAVTVDKEVNRRLSKLHDNTISLAERAAEARKFLDWHTNTVKEAWMDWMDQSDQVLESIRQGRVAIGFESK